MRTEATGYYALLYDANLPNDFAANNSNYYPLVDADLPNDSAADSPNYYALVNAGLSGSRNVG